MRKWKNERGDLKQQLCMTAACLPWFIPQGQSSNPDPCVLNRFVVPHGIIFLSFLNAALILQSYCNQCLPVSAMAQSPDITVVKFKVCEDTQVETASLLIYWLS